MRELALPALARLAWRFDAQCWLGSLPAVGSGTALLFNAGNNWLFDRRRLLGWSRGEKGDIIL